MLIRFYGNNPVADAGVGALQGFAGASLYNFMNAAMLVDPFHAAIVLGGTTLIERMFYSGTSEVFTGKYLLSIPLGPVRANIGKCVSYGLAIATTCKIMHLAGFILSMPPLAIPIGLTCGVMFIGASLFARLRSLPERSSSASSSYHGL